MGRFINAIVAAGTAKPEEMTFSERKTLDKLMEIVRIGEREDQEFLEEFARA